MPKIEVRMAKLEAVVTDHLSKSDIIWSTLSENNIDLKWLKKAFWVLSGAGITFNVTIVTGIIMYLLKR